MAFGFGLPAIIDLITSSKDVALIFIFSSYLLPLDFFFAVSINAKVGFNLHGATEANKKEIKLPGKCDKREYPDMTCAYALTENLLSVKRILSLEPERVFSKKINAY